MHDRSPLSRQIHVQATAAGLINLLVNPAIDFLTFRHEPPQPVWGVDGLVINFVITTLILSTLVGVFSARGARRLSADRTPRARWLRRLPHRGWSAGLVLGSAAAVVAIAGSWLLSVAGVSALSLPVLMAVKAAYCGVLGYVVARLVMTRMLA
ncbi:hypothetical protein AU195_05760 [Mycobacterium sp. IS-1496]|uniref:hypothetical protein n=1 Tax=Mycobacterium sp. IS-1496 TaxID=1772284 RepID=UPI00074152B0|nr:hypothetical protein [Mycobacterium sp. IS-1496]KUI36293.1 hypothetical protein AU195_05760 [Mycobacterium sp. IS-1496]